MPPAQPQSQNASSIPQLAFSAQQQQNNVNNEKRERPGRQQGHQTDKVPPAPFPQPNMASSHQQQQLHASHAPVQQQNSIEGQRCDIAPSKSEHRKV